MNNLVISPIHLDPDPSGHESNTGPAWEWDGCHVAEPSCVTYDADELSDCHDETGDECAVGCYDVEEDE